MTEALTDEARGALFETMLRMRRFEEALIHAAVANKDIGRNHLYIGHEAVGAAVAGLLGPEDLSATTHRNHGHMIARGVDPGKALAEIMGRAGGTNGGRGGTWHICDRKAGFVSTSAMVGGAIGLANGAAFALMKRGQGNVAVAFFGDGALDEGVCYETLNMASLFKFPIIFVCENNSKTGERPSSMLASKRLSDVPRALDLETLTIDGADADAVHAAMARALAKARGGGGPTFVEAVLERWPGSHQMRPEFTTGETDISLAWNDAPSGAPHADWTTKFDPVLRFARDLLARKAMSRDAMQALDRKVSQVMCDARTFAESSPFPPADSARHGAFA